MIRIAHIITGLNAGGAEMMLYKLLSATDRGRYSPLVISMTDEGVLGGRIRALDVPVYALGMKRGAPDPWALLKLAGQLRGEGVQLVQCWMYHADLMGGIAARLAGLPVIWGIRQSNFDADASKKATIRVMRWCARLSRRVPVRIVSCSAAARDVHVRQGYAADKMTIIPNGFPTELYRPDELARAEVRSSLGIPSDALVAGIVGRYDPQKDYQTFIKAAAGLAKKIDEIYFILCGKDITRENPQIAAWINGEGIADRCLLLGQRDDLAKLYCAMDVLVNSSAYGEGFPNVLGEAMSCGVPCVVTDVGDSAAIVGDTGRVVPPRDPEVLAEAIHAVLRMSSEDRKRMGAAARRRIEENFSLRAVVARYEALYEEILAQCAA